MSSSALAADLLEPVVPVEPVVVPEAFSWTGGYIGLNAGWAFDANNGDNGDVTFDRTDGSVGRLFNQLGVPNRGGRIGGNFNSDMDGPFVGAQAGFNYQTGMFVIGVEGDIQWGNIDDDGNNNDNGAGAKAFSGFTGRFATHDLADCNAAGFNCDLNQGRSVRISGGDQSVDWFGTARLRAGVAIDRALIYATGGLAFGDSGFDDFTLAGTKFATVRGTDGLGGRGRATATERFTIRFHDDDDTDVGYALGGGVEYAFTDNVSVKAEYQYINLGGGFFGDDNGDTIHGIGTRDLTIHRQGLAGDFDRLRRGRFDARIDDPEMDFHTLRVGVNVLF